MSHRRERAAAEIRRELMQILHEGVGGEEFPAVYLSKVILAPDLSTARVLVNSSVPGQKVEDEDAFVRPLQKAEKAIRANLMQRMRIRRIPRLVFHFDRGEQNVARIEELLQRIKKRSKNPGTAAVALLLFFFSHAWAGGELERHEASATIMGAEYRVALYGERKSYLASAALAAFDEARRIDRFLSNYRRGSELSKLNEEAGRRAVPVSEELFELLEQCRDYSRRSEGAFDITVGRLMEAWGFFKGSGQLPGRARIARALDDVGYEHVVLDAKARTVRFARRGLQLDPGGIGKGYAVDRIAALLGKYQVKAAMISAGTSSMYGFGEPPGEPRGWRVRISDPLDAGKTAAEVFLRDESLSTSGSYEKFFEAEGAVYSHIMDPRTGMPARGAWSVSVVSARTIDSEAWGTALFVNGEEWARNNTPEGLRVFFCPEEKPCRWLGE